MHVLDIVQFLRACAVLEMEAAWDATYAPSYVAEDGQTQLTKEQVSGRRGCMCGCRVRLDRSVTSPPPPPRQPGCPHRHCFLPALPRRCWRRR